MVLLECAKRCVSKRLTPTWFFVQAKRIFADCSTKQPSFFVKWEGKVDISSRLTAHILLLSLGIGDFIALAYTRALIRMRFTVYRLVAIC